MPPTDASRPDATTDAPRDQTAADARADAPTADAPVTRCASDRDCPTSQFCLREESRCVGCRDDRDCATGQRCGPDRTCHAGCFPGETMTCYAGPAGTQGVGRCTAGARACDDAGNLGPCLGEVVPASGELCGNGLDDDCNGMVDDGCGTACRDGATRPCYDGAPGTDGRGACRAGMQSCARGTWGACAGQALPQAEVCDGMDNDCDGTVDGPRAEATCPTPPNGTAACMGRCVIRAGADGFGDCNGTVADGCETDVRRSSMHCGMCGHACTGRESCRAGACVLDSGGLTAGYVSACVRRPSGNVYCWGYSLYGETGAGAMRSIRLPTMAIGLSDVTQLSESRFHTCALRASGQLVCFGNNESGQIGNGEAVLGAGVLRPSPVSGVGEVAEIVAVEYATCVRQVAGTVVCWGWGNLLGDGSGGNRLLPGAPVPGITDAVRLMGGGGTVCARRSSGEVVCWGQLPNETSAIAESVRSPTVVPFLRNAIDMTAQGQLLCGLFEDGRVLCRGVDFQGTRLTEPTLIPGWTDVASLAKSIVQNDPHRVVCAVRRGGQASCFGDRRSQGSRTIELNPMMPVTVEGVTDAIRVTTMNGGGCVLRATGDVMCWGQGDQGQLGRATALGESLTPVPIMGLPAM